MADSLLLVAALVVVALIFDFLNGLHDAANSIATVVSTRVLSPNVAVAWAAFFNFIAFLFFGLHVAQTVGTGIISPDIVDGQVIFGALMGAIVWNLLTWWGAIPSSSSHALIGGLIGAGAVKAGFSAVVWWGTLKTVAAIVWSPLLGFVLALLLWLVVAWLLMRNTPFAVDRRFRVLQLCSAALYSIGHGANDAQKTMGIIASLLFAKGLLGSAFYVPFWVVLSCQLAMALGTLVGGWRIVKTMGSRITQLKPVQGFCAETAGAMTLYLATSFGVPVAPTLRARWLWRLMLGDGFSALECLAAVLATVLVGRHDRWTPNRSARSVSNSACVSTRDLRLCSIACWIAALESRTSSIASHALAIASEWVTDDGMAGALLWRHVARTVQASWVRSRPPTPERRSSQLVSVVLGPQHRECHLLAPARPVPRSNRPDCAFQG